MQKTSKRFARKPEFFSLKRRNVFKKARGLFSDGGRPFALTWQVVADGLPGNGSEAGFGLTASGLK